MKNSVLISAYLDIRNQKANGKCTLKLRVYQKKPRKQKIYASDLEFTPEYYNRLMTSKKLNTDDRNAIAEINKLVSVAEEVKATMKVFDFTEFERKMGYVKGGTTETLAFHYNLVIGELKRKKAEGTASSYEQSYKSLAQFFENVKERNIKHVEVSEITPGLLTEYMEYMVDTKNRSETTVGIYLRALRTVINYAIHQTSALLPEQYPFGKGKFKIPAPRGRKMALNMEDIKALFRAEPKTEEQAMAKDFWFFSYISNGMNIADIVTIRNKDLSGDQLSFFRKKTARTQNNSMPIQVHLNDFQKEVIHKYREAGNANDYVFGIINKAEPEEVQYKKRKNFTRFINQHMQRLIKDNGLSMDISTYTARHSFTTHAILNNAGISFVQQALGHSDPKTTNTYIASLGMEKSKQINNILFENLNEQ
jgi:integrase/recombinase XerD